MSLDIGISYRVCYFFFCHRVESYELLPSTFKFIFHKGS
ncbi:hypothetical protein B602_0208 [Chlamydia psittaci M56]|nr:hypothetical protein B602_0208 [Chlamydia psittaci M56]